MSEGILLRMVQWGIKKIGKETLLTLLLLLGVCASLVYGLSNIVRQLDSNLLWASSFLGLLIGWYFARSRLSGLLAGFLILLVGLLTIMVSIANFGSQMLMLLQALNQLANQVLHWRPDLPLPDITALAIIFTKLVMGAGTLIFRIFNWLIGLARGQASFDPVATTMVWSLSVWLVMGFAGWVIRRHDKPLLGLLPASALLVSSLAFVRSYASLTLPLLLAVLFLIAKIDYTTREHGWQTKGIDYSEDIRFDLALAVIPVVIGLTLLAALAPTISVHRFIDFVNRIREPQISHTFSTAAPSNLQSSSDEQPRNSETFGKSLGLERLPTPIPKNVLSSSRIAGLPNRHLLGSGPELSQDVIMSIHIDDHSSGSEDSPGNPITPHYYWRGLTYDRYTGNGWSSLPGEPIQYRAGTLAQVPNLSAQQLIKQQVEFTESSDQEGLIYVAGELLGVNQDYKVSWRLAPRTQPADVQPGGSEPNSDLYGALVPSASYTAESLLPQPSEKQLRTARSSYPKWIADHYLNLPASVPQRVLRLAQELTATGATPYDRAVAIETYLRQFPYTLELPPPPSNRDIVDYFLFDLKKGYCDYYASAMVVLSRAAGIPARLAIGYATGTYDAEHNRYTVTAADAHSWPELYFPNYGWIEFEPTASQPASVHLAENASLSDAEINQQLAVTETNQPLTWLQILSGVASLSGLFVLIAILWQISDIWWLGQLTPASTITGVYNRLQRQARRLDVPFQRGDTPSEFSNSLTKQLNRKRQVEILNRFLIPAASEARHLTDFYCQTIYSQHPITTSDQKDIIQLWRKLRHRMWLAVIAKKIL